MDIIKNISIIFISIFFESLPFLPDGYVAVGKYSVSCCTADAQFVGFVLKYNPKEVTADKWYEVEGVLEKGKDSEGYDIMYINAINLKEISSSGQEQYVYPCYSYDNGLCAEVSKYNLEY